MKLPLALCLCAFVLYPPFYADKTRLLVYIDQVGQEQPVKTAADWKRRREHILENFQQVTGPLPDASRKVPLDVTVLEETQLPRFTRKKITFAVEKGDRLSAYLLVPIKRPPRLPGMLCLHQTTPLGKAEPAGLGDKPKMGYAAELAEQGYVTLAPDYPNFGDYRIDAYSRGYASATMKGIWNHMRAIDLLQSLPQVDSQRIGAIGHSLGGHNALFVAVFDARIKALVSSCGFNSFSKYYNGDLTGWSHPGYMPRIASVYGKDPRRMPFDFTELLAALAPRPVFMNAPLGDTNFDVAGVRDCVAAALPVYALLGATRDLKVVYPDSGHDFPDEVRKAAYRFLDGVLRTNSGRKKRGT